MDCFAKLSHKICRNLEQSGIVKAEDSELYIYGINQILFAILNLSSALIIGVICGVFFEVAVFMAAYIPLRSFAGGVHAKTPLRCYIISVIILIGISLFHLTFAKRLFEYKFNQALGLMWLFKGDIS